MGEYTLIVVLAALLLGLALGKAWERYKLRDGRWVDRRRLRDTPHYLLGLHLLTDGRADEAIEELRQATSLDAGAFEIQMILGNLYRHKGQAARAIAVHQSMLQRADLLIVVGRELEIGWLPPLIQQSRNARIQPGAAGYLDASLQARILDVPQGAVTRAMGDIHPSGNPHYWLDPENGKLIARSIATKLIERQPGDRSYLEQRYAAFAQRLDASVKGWLAAAAPANQPRASIPPLGVGRMNHARASQAAIAPAATPCAPRAASFSKFLMPSTCTRGGQFLHPVLRHAV